MALGPETATPCSSISQTLLISIQNGASGDQLGAKERKSCGHVEKHDNVLLKNNQGV